MLSYKSRIFLFLFGCMIIRFLFAYVAKVASKQTLRYLGYLALIPAVGMVFIYVTGSRDVAFEAGGKVWWKCLRPVHSLLYFLFAYNAITGNKNSAWKFLALDAVIGLIAFLGHHLVIGE